MRKILFCAIILLLPLIANGQSIVSGKIADKSSGEPAGWATVALMAADSTIVAGTACDEAGVYELKAAPGNYILMASLMGYKDYHQSISVKNGKNEIGAIALEPDAQMLEGAKITEKVPLVELKIDKVVMNVSQSAFALGSDAYELLKKAPGVTIDKDGNVQLNGKTVSVWIDGRPSYVDGENLVSLLKSTDGGSIDKFELMEHPSAKYDASGQGGIINIKTKRNFLNGFNGSLNQTIGSMYYPNLNITPIGQSTSANLSYRSGKTNTFLNLFQGSSARPYTIVNNMSIESSDYHQIGSSAVSANSIYSSIKLGNDWFLNDRNTIGVIFQLPYANSSNEALSSYSEQYVSDVLVSRTDSDIKEGPASMNRGTANLNYTHIFDSAKSREITANLDYYRSNFKRASTEIDTIRTLVPSYEEQLSVRNMSSNALYNIYSAKADYQSTILNKWFLETGIKWAMSLTDNTTLETRTDMPNYNQDFIYREHIAAAYASVSGQLGTKWSFKAGLRGEYTYSFGDWISSNTQSDRSYLDIFPTIYAGYQPSENWRFSASYSRRINRPSYYQLSPDKSYIEAKLYTVGNPDLIPEYSDNITLSTGYGQYLSFSLSGQTKSNALTQTPRVESDGTQVMTWNNIGSSLLGGASFNVSSLPVAKWLLWTLSANGYYMTTTTTIPVSVTMSSWGVQLYTDFTFVLPKSWTLTVEGEYGTPSIYGYYRSYSQKDVSMAAKKSFLDNKLLLGINVNDLFNTSDSSFDILPEAGTGANTTVIQKLYRRWVMFSITWNFGKAQKPLKQRKVGNLEEASRAGSGN